MPIQAYVFVECALGNVRRVVDALLKVSGVQTAHAVTGAYDVIVFVHAESMTVLGDLLTRGIHRIPGVLKTTTNVVVEPGSAGEFPERNRGRRG